MASADTIKRQQELQDARRRQRPCVVDGCRYTVPAHSATDMCKRCWRKSESIVDSGGMLRDNSGEAPEPPTGMTYLPAMSAQAPRHRWTVLGACVLCGSTQLGTVDHLGRRRADVRVVRQLIGVFDAVPFVVGSRCAECQNLVRKNVDKLNPVLAAVAEALGRSDLTGDDLWALHVISARAAGETDPEPPGEPWAFTTRGPGLDAEAADVAPLSDAELARLRFLLSKSSE